jgi:hypothetical protein
MKKNFYHKIGVAELLAEALRRPDDAERGQWLLQLALDLEGDEAKSCKTTLGKELVTRTKKGRKKAKESGKIGAKKRWEKSPENSNIDSNPIIKNGDPIASSRSSSRSSSNKPKTLNHKSLNKFTDEDMKLAQWIFNLIAVLDPGRKKPNFDTWANTVRLMREIDKLTHREVAEVFKWANGDEFWKSNILSVSKLREKFSDLKIKMKNNGKKESKTLSQQMDESKEQRYGVDTRRDGEESKIIDITPAGIFSEDRYKLPRVN